MCVCVCVCVLSGLGCIHTADASWDSLAFSFETGLCKVIEGVCCTAALELQRATDDQTAPSGVSPKHKTGYFIYTHTYCTFLSLSRLSLSSLLPLFHFFVPSFLPFTLLSFSLFHLAQVLWLTLFFDRCCCCRWCNNV